MREPVPDSRWAQIEALFQTAVELPPESREVYLDSECGGDRDLRREVLELLDYEERDSPALIDALQSGAASVITEEPLIGRLVGPYRLEREIGRGGMAVVYLGVRDDGQFQQRVAIKLIKRGMDTAAVIDRLRRERRILAGLEHPHIGRLLDGGSTADGLPYLVMEYVDGLPVDQYCRQHELAIEQRCELMAKICDTVAFAHRKLVAHRDLKPANILIAADGTPKLLDFGLAKILDADSTGEVTVNFAHGRPMTPEYASPEQILGQELTTATDIYSLGVVLYELLAGVRPYRLERGASNHLSHQWEQIVCETDPPRPSSVAARDRRRLEGDLDNIVLKAMHKDADLRYASADDLADDLRRYLEMRPVRARADSWSYRAAKFMRRRKLPILATAAVAVSLIAGTAIAISQARKAIAAQKRAEERVAQIVSLSDQSLSGVYALVEHLPGAFPARKEMIATALTQLEDLSRDAGSNLALRIALAKAYFRLGALQGGPDVDSMGNVPAAIKAYRDGLALLEGFPAAGKGREYAMLWLDLRRNLGRLIGQRDPSAGTALLLETMEALRKLPASLLADPQLARSRANLFLTLSRVNHTDLPKAREYGPAFVNAITELLKQRPTDSGLLYDLSVGQVELAWIAGTGGDLETAAAWHESAVRIRENLVKQSPSNTLYTRALMLAYEHCAEIQGGGLDRNLGHPELARLYFAKARPMVEAAASDPQNLDAAASYAAFLLKSASVETTPENAAESIVTLRRAISMFEKLPGSSPSGPYAKSIASAHRFIGARLALMKNYSGALDEYRQALSIADAVLADHPDREALQETFETEAAIASQLSQQRDVRGALQHARKLIDRAKAGAAHGGDTALNESWIARARSLIAECSARSGH